MISFLSSAQQNFLPQHPILFSSDLSLILLLTQYLYWICLSYRTITIRRFVFFSSLFNSSSNLSSSPDSTLFLSFSLSLCNNCNIFRCAYFSRRREMSAQENCFLKQFAVWCENISSKPTENPILITVLCSLSLCSVMVVFCIMRIGVFSLNFPLTE